MINILLYWSKAARIFALIGFLNAFVLTAADAPPPAPPAAPPRDAGAPGGRPGRGPNGPGGGGGGGNFQGQRGGATGLDDQQLQLYRQATMKSSAELGKLDEQLRVAQKELVQAVLAEKYDEKIVREKAEGVAKIQIEITTLRAKALSTVAPTLKPEQRDQLENSRFGAAMLMGGGGGFGFGGGPPLGGRRAPGGP